MVTLSPHPHPPILTPSIEGLDENEEEDDNDDEHEDDDVSSIMTKSLDSI